MKLNVIYNNEKKFEAEHRSMKEAIKFTKKVLRENRMVGKFYILSSVDGKQVCSISTASPFVCSVTIAVLNTIMSNNL